MAYTPEDSAIKVDRKLEEKLKGLTFEEIKEALKEAAISQNLVHRDWDETILVPNEPGTVPQKVGKVVVINGVAHSLVADDEAALLAAENQLLRETFNSPARQTEQMEQPRNERGQFTTQLTQPVSAEEKALLQVQFQLGQIDTATYLEKSGALEDFLEKQGVPLADLQETVAEKQNARLASSWADATQEFLQGAGNWWPGGQENLAKMGKVLIEMGAEDFPSAENLRRAAEYLRDSGQLVEPPELAAAKKEAELTQRINEANDRYDLRSILQSGSSLFGR